jgi:hypothetical protein
LFAPAAERLLEHGGGFFGGIAMPVIDDLHFSEGYAVYRPVGEVALHAAAAAVTQVIKLSHQHQVTRLLVDITALTGFEPPSLSERYEMVVQWADAARGQIKLAMLSRPEMIDPQRFDVTVARNRGMHANIVASEAEALAWLLGSQVN